MKLIRLTSLLICVTLLPSSLLPFTDAVAAPPDSRPNLVPDLQGTTPVVIEGRVEQVVSGMQPRGLITSRAIVKVDEVLQGTLQGDQVTIRYEGGTVGELTLRVSDEPYLAEGMRLRAKLTPDEGGDYRIAIPDTDLTILEGEIGAAWVPTGEKWPDLSIPVPIRINDNCADIFDSSEVTAVQNAMNTWTNASCSYFAYSYPGGACTMDTLDGVNCVSWSPASGGGTLAVSHCWSIGSDIIETDITFYDGDHTWSTNGSAFDVESVALHELGHSLGLDHTPISAAVMYYQINSGDLKRSLHTDDRNGVCNLYVGTPTAPSGLTVTPIPQTQINLSWTDNSNNEDGFKIEQSIDGGPWAQIDTVGANITTYPNTGLACEKDYSYRVRAYNTYGDSGYSNTASAVPAGDVYELDNVPNDAKLIAANGVTQTHNFHASDDDDWVKFIVTAGTPYTITTSNLGVGGGTGNDTVLELYSDTDFINWIERNDDCPGGGRESCINNWITSTVGTYYIKAYFYNHNEGGCTGYEYDLTVVGGFEKVYLPIILKNSQ